MTALRVVEPIAGEDSLLNRLEYLHASIYHQYINSYADLSLLDSRLPPSVVFKKRLQNNIGNIYSLGYLSAGAAVLGASYNEDVANNIGRSVDHLDQLNQDLRDRLKEQLRIAYSRGESTAKIRDRVRGVLDVERTTANRYARTLTNDVYNQARLDKYQEDGVEAVQYVAAHNEETCLVCRALDGTIWRIDDPAMIRPPTHWQCRCRLVIWRKGIPGPRKFDEDTEQLIMKTVDDFNKYWNPGQPSPMRVYEVFNEDLEASPAVAHGYMETHYKGWRESLPDEKVDVLAKYQDRQKPGHNETAYYDVINNYLISGTFDPGNKWFKTTGELLAANAKIGGAISTEIGRPTRVYRGIKDVPKFFGAMVGDKIELSPGFASTSLSFAWANKWYAKGKTPVIIQIDLPASTRAAYMPLINKKYLDEYELLLKPGHTILIDSVEDYVGPDGVKKRFIKARLIK